MKLICTIFFFLAITSFASGSENCGMMGGTCRDVCNSDEKILEGAFIDCGEKQECCVYRPPSKERSEDAGKEGQWKKPAK